MRSNPLDQQGPSGVLVIDKAPDMTSHDVVAIARRALNTKKIGHCGTLDPMATGLLMLVIGRATKIQDLLMSEDKEYEGTMTLGATTSTQDRQGEVQETREVPAFTAEQIDAAFARYTGDFEQIPPMVSAIKKDGVPLYKLARKGETVEREPRLIHVYRFVIDRFSLPEIDFTVSCTKGTYVRTLAADLGEMVGCGAHLTALRRTASGQFSLEEAKPLNELLELSEVELQKHILPMPKAKLRLAMPG